MNPVKQLKKICFYMIQNVNIKCVNSKCNFTQKNVYFNGSIFFSIRIPGPEHSNTMNLHERKMPKDVINFDELCFHCFRAVRQTISKLQFNVP